MKKKSVFISISFVIIAGLFLIFAFVFNRKDDPKKLDLSSYPEGTKINTTNNLKKKHCLDKICVSDVYIYYNNGTGTISYTLNNKSKNANKGNFKLIFDNNNEVVINYDFTKEDNYESFASYMGNDLENVNDYKLVKLTKSEESKIIK